MANKARSRAPGAKASITTGNGQQQQQQRNVKEGAQPATASVQAAQASDYSSIVLVFDHLMVRRDGHCVQKMVMSTQSEVESVLALVNYYGEQRILAHPSMVGVFQQGGQSPNPCYVYTSPQNISAVMSVSTWAMFVNHPDWGNGSELQATDLLTKAIAEFHAQIKNANNGITTPLLVISPTLQ